MRRIFVKGTLREYWKKHPEVEQYLKTWFNTAINSDWKNPADIKLSYVNASILKDGRVVFNIKGNSHRLVVKCDFQRQWIFIRFVGTHEEYDKINANLI